LKLRVLAAATCSDPSLHRLFAAFVRLGATAFGGPAAIMQIRKIVVEQKQWMDKDAFGNGMALCQAIPGATAMQMSAYVGLKKKGIPGAFVAFVGFGLPAFAFMMILTTIYLRTFDIRPVISLFEGLQAMIVAIIAFAVFTFGTNYLKKWGHFLIAAFAAILFGLRVSPILVIPLTAILGIAFFRRDRTPQKTHETKRSPWSESHYALAIAVAAMGFTILFVANRGLFDLALLMSRIDLFAFGGGFSSVPLMYHEVVTLRSWMDGPTLMNGIALGQVTPGPIVITATFIGYWLYGPIGGIVATLAIFLPSFLIVVGVEPFFDRLRASPYFNSAIAGILCSFVGFLLSVTASFAWVVPWDVPRVILTCATFIALYYKVDILWIVLVGALVSVLIF